MTAANLIAGPPIAEEDLGRRLRCEQGLDLGHAVRQPLQRRRRQMGDQGLHGVASALVESGEGPTAGVGQRQAVLAAVELQSAELRRRLAQLARLAVHHPEAVSHLIENIEAHKEPSTVCDQERSRHRGHGLGVYIGSKGRPINLAVLESTGLEHLDKLILRCMSRANYTTAAPGKPPLQWIFKYEIKHKHATPVFAPSRTSEQALVANLSRMI